jgi:hypothetical protein
MPNIEDLRHQARQLCAERGLNIQPYGNAWWIVGDGVSRVVGELAGLNGADLMPMALMER